MTIQEMKNLKLGDVVQDLDLYKKTNEEIFCLVAEIQDDRLYCISVDKKYEGRYPHIFRFNEKDCLKLSLPINNINKNIYKAIFDNCRSIETFSKRLRK